MHHSFDVNFAAQYGIPAAIVIHHFQHWITYNMRLGRNKHDDRTWTYQSLDEIAAHFPYLSKSEVFEIITRLCDGKGRRSKKEGLDFEPVLIRGNFNKNKFDKTTWYAFKNQEKFTILAQAKIDESSSQHPDQLEPTPIPHTKPHTGTNRTTTPKNEESAESDDTQVVSFFSQLNLSPSFRKTLIKKHSLLDLELAASRALKWDGRQNDQVGVLTALREAKNWNDSLSLKDIQSKNVEFLKELKKLDGYQLANERIHIGPKYIEFICTNANQSYIFQIDNADFEHKVTKHIENLLEKVSKKRT